MLDVELDSLIPRIDTARRLCFSIAGVSMALTSDDPEMRFAVGGASKLFVVEESDADSTVRAVWGDLSDEAGGELLFDSGALWQLFRDGDGYLFRFTTPYYGAIPYKVARFNADFTSGEVLMHRPYFDTSTQVNPLEYPLDELLMLNLLSQGRGAELHSCGVVDATGAGYLFSGQSGAGKTTTARFWEQEAGARILSDDRIILRETDGHFKMYGTPWHGEGELSSPHSAPLKSIFFLKHEARNELVALSRVEAAARLFSCSFPTFHNRDGLDFTLAFYDEVTRRVPCYELGFLPDEGVVEFIRQHSN